MTIPETMRRELESQLSPTQLELLTPVQIQILFRLSKDGFARVHDHLASAINLQSRGLCRIEGGIYPVAIKEDWNNGQ